jgi:predicted dehydrogenase
VVRDVNETPGIAVVGAGYWGRNLVRNFALTPRASLLWVVDQSEAVAQRSATPYADVEATANLDEVLSDPAVEGIAIATPAATHAALAMAAIEHGKHVLIEKPLASTADDARAVVEAAEAAGLVLMIDHTFCYTSAVRCIRELIASGELGDFQYLDSVRINLGLVQPDVDVFWDLAPHDLSILSFVLPEGLKPVSVAAQGIDPLGIGKPSLGYVSLGYSNGAIAHLHVNWLSPVKVRTMIIGGSEKMLVWDDLKPAQRLSIFDTGVQLDDEPKERHQRLVSYRAGDMVAPALEEREALARMVDEFAGAIVAGRKALTSGRDGLEVVLLLTAIQESLAAGGATVSLGAGSLS